MKGDGVDSEAWEREEGNEWWKGGVEWERDEGDGVAER